MRDRQSSIHRATQPILMEPASWQMASRICFSCHRILNLIPIMLQTLNVLMTCRTPDLVKVSL